MKRRLGIALGCVCVALAVVGILVPGLPATCFLLAALWLFTRTSPSLRRRLLAHPTLGAYVRAAEGRSMPVRAKVVSLLAMWAGVALVARSEGTVGTWSLAVACLAAIGSGVLVFGVRSAALPRVEPEAERG